jgi:hypothetical protein
MTKSITICAQVVGLICPLTEAPGLITESSQDSAAGPSESDMAKANNPITPHERHLLSKLLRAYGIRRS